MLALGPRSEEYPILPSAGQYKRWHELRDVAPWMGLPAAEKVRFARGVARLTQWCEVDHRTFDWAPRSL